MKASYDLNNDDVTCSESVATGLSHLVIRVTFCQRLT